MSWIYFRDSEEVYDDEDDCCYECGGDGYILADCFEDTCCCADPEMEHGHIRCPVCGLDGGLGTP